MSRRRIIEGRWRCSSCDTADIGGRHKTCPTCGNPREGADGESDFRFGGTTASGASVAETVTDVDAVDLARAGTDWHCSTCGAANRGDVGNCRSCGAAPGETTPAAAAAPPARKARWPLVAGVLGVLALGAFWATRTQDLSGEVTRSWTHTVDLQRFTPLTTGGWQRTLGERAPVMPVDGAGEVAGVAGVRDCQQRQDGTRKVADGTERVCRQRTRQVQDGTREQCTVKDLGNGFAEEVCTDVPVTRSESYEHCEDQTRYREEPVYDTWCTYDTWTWKSVDQARLSGGWETPAWPQVEAGPLDRTVRSHSYGVIVRYADGDDLAEHAVTPDTLAELESWTRDQPVTVQVNNLGTVTGLIR